MIAILTITLLLLALVAWNACAWPAPEALPPGAPPAPDDLSILIPARNEEHNLPALLDSLRGQPGVLEILVYDDHSTDGTAAAIAAAARADPRIRRIEPEPLPSGWTGKTFACDRLSAIARGEWRLFLDADVRLQPGAAARMRHAARARGVTFLSCWPGLDAVGAWEKMFMPMLNFSVFTLFPAALALTRRDPSLGLAHGACILVQRDAYRRAGGHAAVKAELFEDTALSREWRRRGERGACLDGQDIVRVRMYDSLPALWRGFEKIFFPAFRFQVNFWLFLLFHAVVFVVPPVAAAASAIAGRPDPAAWGATAAAVAMRLLQAVRFRYPLWPAGLHPLGELGLLAVGLGSWHRCRLGSGVSWKGRRYHGARRG